jgi:hypothetical protein
MYESKLETPARLKELLWKNRYMSGAKIVRILMGSPGQPFPVPELCRRIYRPDLSPGHFSRLWKAAFSPLPGIDHRARREYSKRLEQLKARQAGGEEDPELDWEIAWLQSELKRCVRVGGSLKTHTPEHEMAYHALYTAVWKFMRKVGKSDPEIFFLLRANLKTGHSFLWRRDLDVSGETPVQAPSRLEPAA